MGDFTTASSSDSASSTRAAAAAAMAAWGGGAATGAGSARGAGCATAWKVGAPALRTRTFRPSRSSSNSASSWSRTRARIFSISEKSIQFFRLRFRLRRGSGGPAETPPARRRARGSPCQYLAPVVGDEHVVLDPYAANAGDVGARLDREHHARLDHLVGKARRLAGDPGLLVYFEAEPVAGAVAARLPQAVPFQHRPGRGVDRAGRHPRANRPDGRILRLPNGRVQPRLAV